MVASRDPEWAQQVELHINHYVRVRGWSPSTCTTHRREVSRWVDWALDEGLDPAGAYEEVERFLSGLQLLRGVGPVSKKTKRNYRVCLRAWFDWCEHTYG